MAAPLGLQESPDLLVTNPPQGAGGSAIPLVFLFQAKASQQEEMRLDGLRWGSSSPQGGQQSL